MSEDLQARVAQLEQDKLDLEARVDLLEPLEQTCAMLAEAIRAEREGSPHSRAELAGMLAEAEQERAALVEAVAMLRGQVEGLREGLAAMRGLVVHASAPLASPSSDPHPKTPTQAPRYDL